MLIQALIFSRLETLKIESTSELFGESDSPYIFWFNLKIFGFLLSTNAIMGWRPVWLMNWSPIKHNTKTYITLPLTQ